MTYQAHCATIHKSLLLKFLVTCEASNKNHKRQSCTTQEPNIKDGNLRHTVIQLPIKSWAILQSVTFNKHTLKNERSRGCDFNFIPIV